MALDDVTPSQRASATTYESLPRRARRRLLARAILRPGVTTGGLVLLYYALPLGVRVNRETAIGLGAGLVVVVALIAWQAHAITKARFPRVRAIEALATTIAFFLVLFASAYFLTGRSQPNAFSEALSRTDALYFTVTIFSSVGFGDIVARSEGARVMAMVQMLGSLALLGAGARILLTAVQTGLRGSRDRGE